MKKAAQGDDDGDNGSHTNKPDRSIGARLSRSPIKGSTLASWVHLLTPQNKSVLECSLQHLFFSFFQFVNQFNSSLCLAVKMSGFSFPSMAVENGDKNRAALNLGHGISGTLDLGIKVQAVKLSELAADIEGILPRLHDMVCAKESGNYTEWDVY